MVRWLLNEGIGSRDYYFSDLSLCPKYGLDDNERIISMIPLSMLLES